MAFVIIGIGDRSKQCKARRISYKSDRSSDSILDNVFVLHVLASLIAALSFRNSVKSQYHNPSCAS
jgi:hypothetical protein